MYLSGGRGLPESLESQGETPGGLDCVSGGALAARWWCVSVRRGCALKWEPHECALRRLWHRGSRQRESGADCVQPPRCVCFHSRSLCVGDMEMGESLASYRWQRDRPGILFFKTPLAFSPSSSPAPRVRQAGCFAALWLSTLASRCSFSRGVVFRFGARFCQTSQSLLDKLCRSFHKNK